jgi:hypothetical protein
MADNPAEIPELPSGQAIDRLVSLLEPYRRITQPKFYGIGNLPDDGSLLVGNHTIYGFLDLPFMLAEVWKRRRIAVRGAAGRAIAGVGFAIVLRPGRPDDGRAGTPAARGSLTGNPSRAAADPARGERDVKVPLPVWRLRACVAAGRQLRGRAAGAAVAPGAALGAGRRWKASCVST